VLSHRTTSMIRTSLWGLLLLAIVSATYFYATSFHFTAIGNRDDEKELRIREWIPPGKNLKVGRRIFRPAIQIVGNTDRATLLRWANGRECKLVPIPSGGIIAGNSTIRDGLCDFSTKDLRIALMNAQEKFG
jgi:hypothetical protein